MFDCNYLVYHCVSLSEVKPGMKCQDQARSSLCDQTVFRDTDHNHRTFTPSRFIIITLTMNSLVLLMPVILSFPHYYCRHFVCPPVWQSRTSCSLQGYSSAQNRLLDFRLESRLLEARPCLWLHPEYPNASLDSSLTWQINDLTKVTQSLLR